MGHFPSSQLQNTVIVGGDLLLFIHLTVTMLLGLMIRRSIPYYSESAVPTIGGPYRTFHLWNVITARNAEKWGSRSDVTARGLLLPAFIA